MGARLRRLFAVTTALTFALILLGVYTASAGAGLSCGADWPFCNGGLMWETVPGFIEWFHRLVAMITGFFILGSTWGAWRHYDSTRIRAAATLALVVLPVQILLGGGTVLFYGAWVQVAHHGAALIIFGALLATTLWAYEEPRRKTGATAEAGSGYPSDD
jgi:cytochrome c oxidase assembly protein subunit 15